MVDGGNGAGKLLEDIARIAVRHEDPSIALRAINKFNAHAHRFNRALDTATQDQTSNDQGGAASVARGTHSPGRTPPRPPTGASST